MFAMFYSTLCARVPGLTSRHHHNFLAAIIVSTMALILQRTLALLCVMHGACAPPGSKSSAASSSSASASGSGTGKKKGNPKAVPEATAHELRGMVEAPTSEQLSAQETALRYWSEQQVSLRQQEIADNCPLPPDLSDPST